MLLNRVLARRSREPSQVPESSLERPCAGALVRTRLADDRDLHRVRKDALIQRVEAALRDANDRHHMFKLDGHAG